MECRGVANVIGAPDDAHPIGCAQTPLVGSGFQPVRWTKMGIVYNPRDHRL
jgi:hypothetical protein